MYSAHIKWVTLSRALAFRWEQMPVSWLERWQRLPPALPCFLTPAPQLYTLTGTHVGSLHLLGSHKVECSQTKPKYTSLGGAPDVCQRCCSQQCPVQHLPFILHVRKPLRDLPDLFTPQRPPCPCPTAMAPAEGWRTTTGWGPHALAKQEGKGRGDFQKGQKPQCNEETEIWAVTHFSTGKRRRRIQTVP